MPTNTGESVSAHAGDVDVRGPRFGAWITSAVLVLALVLAGLSPAAAAVVLTAQAIVFASGALWGPRRSPYGRVYARIVAPRLGPVTEREPVAPVKFSQLIGLLFAIVGVIGFVAGVPVLGEIATAFALVAALLNAAFGICLACRLYPLVTRFRRIRASA